MLMTLRDQCIYFRVVFCGFRARGIFMVTAGHCLIRNW